MFHAQPHKSSTRPQPHDCTKRLTSGLDLDRLFLEILGDEIDEDVTPVRSGERCVLRIRPVHVPSPTRVNSFKETKKKE